MKRNETSELIKLTQPAICSLVLWIESHLAEFERIDIHQWYGRFWYVVVKDTRADRIPGIHTSNMRIGFTTDVQEDRIFWNDTTCEHQDGGNCFVRAPKWKALARKRFDFPLEGKMHQYRDSYLKGLKA